ncbi:MAG: nucleotide exchange factor GrpE [Candidatus Nomurabacteria bacterium]|jgi:molecular chaperone GrpE|nr:nucleotide exchange factor GrpE [Candidatus Nomurabacteria bacterium]
MKKHEELLTKIAELTGDLQRTRADFENYRKNVEIDKQRVANVVKITTISKILPLLDDIERAITHVPASLAENDWAKGVVALQKKLEAGVAALGVARINATAGVDFDPDVHEAVAFDEGAGEKEVVAEELRAGYKMDGETLRPAMVKVTRK